MEARLDELTTEIKSFKESSSKPKTPPAVMRSPIHEKIVLDCKGKPYECYEENFLDGDNLDSVVDLLGYLKSSASFLPEKGHEVTSFGEPYSYTGSRDSEPDPIPPELAKVVDLLSTKFSISDLERPNSILINFFPGTNGLYINDIEIQLHIEMYCIVLFIPVPRFLNE